MGKFLGSKPGSMCNKDKVYSQSRGWSLPKILKLSCCPLSVSFYMLILLIFEQNAYLAFVINYKLIV